MSLCKLPVTAQPYVQSHNADQALLSQLHTSCLETTSKEQSPLSLPSFKSNQVGVQPLVIGHACSQWLALLCGLFGRCEVSHY